MSILVIQMGKGRKYSEEIVNNFKLVLKEGNTILSERGNTGYDSIKLIEILSIRRRLELAEDPETSVLQIGINDHILKSIEKKEMAKEELNKIKSIIDSLIVPDDIAVIYGCFRFGRDPYINVEDKLKSLKELVRKNTEIDENYSELLASDLAKMCIMKHFKTNNKWPVDISRLDKDSPFFKFVESNTWPSRNTLNQLPDVWNTLPITQIYEIPKDINLSTLYSDKRHSCGRKELYNLVMSNPNNPIASKIVLKTLLDSYVLEPKD